MHRAAVRAEGAASVQAACDEGATGRRRGSRSCPEQDQTLRFHEVSRSFGRGSRRRAVLCGLSLELPPGSAVYIGGSNGAGKTTLLRIAAGMLAPDEGEVTLGPLHPRRDWLRFHQRIGFASAGDRGLYARLSVRAHLDFWTAIALMSARERARAIRAALIGFGLAHLADRRADRLSQGQRQRLRLALAFVHKPQVVLLDEPRNSLDEDGLAMLGAAVGELLSRSGAVLWCAPLGERQPVDFDRTLRLEDGRLWPA